MTGQVHANLEHLKQLQRAVGTAEEEIGEAIRKLNRALDRTDWHDSARADFESKLSAAGSSVKRTTEQIVELKPILRREIAALEQYLRNR